MTHRPGRIAAAPSIRNSDLWRPPARRLAAAAGAVGDQILAVLIVVVATLAWSPLIGLSVARETLAAKRHERARLSEIDRTQSSVWARQARRNALGWQRQGEAPRRRPGL